jgi:pilus assembly protein CpaE
LQLAKDKPEVDTPLLIAINASPDVIERLEQAAADKSWHGKLFKCNSYISAAKRPFFLSSIKECAVSIAFIDFDKSVEQATESAQYLAQNFPGMITVVALTKSRDSGNILNAMRAGCSEFINLPLHSGALKEFFERLERRWLSTRSTQPRAGSLITFFGVKGGVGSTILASHLALFLAHYHNKRTLLIDHRRELGHVSLYLGVGGNPCFFQDVVRNVDRLDSELLHGFLAEHVRGLNILASPDICGSSQGSDGEAVSRTIDFLRGEFDYVIADCDITSEDRSLPFIASSQCIYLVATPEVSAIRDLSRYVDRLAQIDSSLEKVRLVLNRVSSSDAIQVEEIERATALPVTVRIPNSCQEFTRACNLGEPLHLDGKSVLASRLSEWAAQVAGTPPSPAVDKKSKSPLAFWKTASNGSLVRKGFA